MAKSNKILIISIVVSLMGLISSTKPSLSHSGHNHSKPQLKQEEKQSEAQNKINQEIEKIEKTSPKHNQIQEDIQMPTETSNPNNTQESTNSEEFIKSPSAIASKQFNLIPQPTELVFFLLLASPYLLYTVKKKMYKRESN